MNSLEFNYFVMLPSLQLLNKNYCKATCIESPFGLRLFPSSCTFECTCLKLDNSSNFPSTYIVQHKGPYSAISNLSKGFEKKPLEKSKTLPASFPFLIFVLKTPGAHCCAHSVWKLNPLCATIYN